MTKKHLFSWLLKKAVSMALWTKAITCDKAGFKSRLCQEHQAGKNTISVNPVILSNFSSCLRALRVLRGEIIPEISVNPRSINNAGLLGLNGLYTKYYRLTTKLSTKDYVRKNNLFMQNKAKFRKVKFDVTKVLTKDYDQMDTWSIGKKQSQTNPNKAKLKKAKMNVTSALTKEYENKPPIRAPKKQTQYKAKQTQLKPIKTQNKPNSNPTCRGVASGEDGNKPNLKPVLLPASPFCFSLFSTPAIT